MGMFQWLQHQLDVIMYGVGVKWWKQDVSLKKNIF